MKYFTIEELCYSDMALDRKIENNPTPIVCDNLIALVENILDPARKALNKAIHVNSGFRNDKLNKAVKGVSASQHCKGEAADIELGGKTEMENKLLFEWIRDNCEFDQLINEYDFSWIHVSYRKVNNRKQILEIG